MLHCISQSLFGRADFRGEEAEKALKELKEVDILATAEDESNKKLLVLPTKPACC
jgi:hypothetical protein